MIRNFYNETWKPVIFDQIISEQIKYKISNLGRLCKVVDGVDVLIEKPYPINGYSTIPVFKKDGKRTARYIHKLVAQHHLEKPEDAKFVLHLDYDKSNNIIENLKWATKREKEVHQFNNPHYKTRKKVIPTSKLTETEVIRLKKRLFDPKRRTRLKILARQFGVSEMQLHRIKTGENWGHVKI
ncbi:HNH endonuclease [Olleya namhaensis]|uniref:HNH endonuclease n=1 Tax=Olleya namhaensis TaxID=1144750 RepID=UPI002491103D|nr:HNH endonuclease [Olleya namhaensis]